MGFGTQVAWSPLWSFLYTSVSDNLITAYASPKSFAGRFFAHGGGVSMGLMAMGVSYAANKRYDKIVKEKKFLPWLESENSWQNNAAQLATRAITHILVGGAVGLGTAVLIPSFNVTPLLGVAAGGAAFIGPQLARLVYRIISSILSKLGSGFTNAKVSESQQEKQMSEDLEDLKPISPHLKNKLIEAGSDCTQMLAKEQDLPGIRDSGFTNAKVSESQQEKQMSEDLEDLKPISPHLKNKLIEAGSDCTQMLAKEQDLPGIRDSGFTNAKVSESQQEKQMSEDLILLFPRLRDKLTEEFKNKAKDDFARMLANKLDLQGIRDTVVSSYIYAQIRNASFKESLSSLNDKGVLIINGQPTKLSDPEIHLINGSLNKINEQIALIPSKFEKCQEVYREVVKRSVANDYHKCILSWFMEPFVNAAVFDREDDLTLVPFLVPLEDGSDYCLSEAERVFVEDIYKLAKEKLIVKPTT